MTTQLETLKVELSRHVVGQERVVERLIISMVANGHCLLEGVPGVGKTMMTSTLARMVGGTFAQTAVRQPGFELIGLTAQAHYHHAPKVSVRGIACQGAL